MSGCARSCDRIPLRPPALRWPTGTGPALGLAVGVLVGQLASPQQENAVFTLAFITNPALGIASAVVLVLGCVGYTRWVVACAAGWLSAARGTTFRPALRAGQAAATLVAGPDWQPGPGRRRYQRQRSLAGHRAAAGGRVEPHRSGTCTARDRLPTGGRDAARRPYSRPLPAPRNRRAGRAAPASISPRPRCRRRVGGGLGRSDCRSGAAIRCTVGLYARADAI